MLKSFKQNKMAEVINAPKRYVFLKKSRAWQIKNPSVFLVRDKKGKVIERQQIQYCDNLETIIVKKQLEITDKPIKTPILVDNGQLIVEQERPTLIEFIEKHEDNVKNGGKLFKELNPEEDDLFEIEELDKKTDAKYLLKQSSDDQVIGLAIWLWGQTHANSSANRLRISLTKAIDNTENFAGKVTEYLENKENKERHIISLALQHEVISIPNGKNVVWGTEVDGEVIFIAPQQQDAIQTFATFLRNDKAGRQQLSHIAEKLKPILEEKKQNSKK